LQKDFLFKCCPKEMKKIKTYTSHLIEKHLV